MIKRFLLLFILYIPFIPFSIYADEIVGTGSGIVTTPAAAAGSGDVTAAASLGDNLLIRGDGGAKGIQNSGITVDDSDNITGVVNITSTGTITPKILSLGAAGTQSITAASDQINAELFSHFDVSSDADYVMTSTPTIANGIEGQLLYLHNSGSFTIDLQDESVLTGSNIILNGAEGTIKVDSIVTLMYDTDEAAWQVTSNPNTASAGANADILEVRNVSGVAISAGKTVYITGWNVGQNRPTIDLADGDDSAKIPTIGVTSATISDNTNGTVITFGNAVSVIDTSSASIGDGVWLSTTAGEVVFTRPSVDDIQRIGTVARSHASAGVVLINGAGRVNDTPIDIIVNAVQIGTPTPDIQVTTDGNGVYTRAVINQTNNETWSTDLETTADTAIHGGSATKHDFGAMSGGFEIPNAAAPTVDVAGEVAVDTTDDQLKYYGGAERVIAYERTACLYVENLAAADDDIAMYMANDAITITGIGVHCDGTCTTPADIDLSDRAGNVMTHGAPTVSTGTGSTTFTAVTAANALVAGEGLEFSVANAVSPETDTYLICFTYTVNAQ